MLNAIEFLIRYSVEFDKLYEIFLKLFQKFLLEHLFFDNSKSSSYIILITIKYTSYNENDETGNDPISSCKYKTDQGGRSQYQTELYEVMNTKTQRTKHCNKAEGTVAIFCS